MCVFLLKIFHIALENISIQSIHFILLNEMKEK